MLNDSIEITELPLSCNGRVNLKCSREGCSVTFLKCDGPIWADYVQRAATEQELELTNDTDVYVSCDDTVVLRGSLP